MLGRGHPPSLGSCDGTSGRLAHDCDLDSQFSYLDQNLKGWWQLLPARCFETASFLAIEVIQRVRTEKSGLRYPHQPFVAVGIVA
jgi:hypothetical protein